MLLSQVQVSPIVHLAAEEVGSIDARERRRAGRKVEEPRRAFLEELEGPPQFRPWVAGPEIMPKISILGENGFRFSKLQSSIWCLKFYVLKFFIFYVNLFLLFC